MVKAILFDLDGTLVDTLADLADAVNTVLAENGLPIHDYEAYRRFVGNGAKVLVELASDVHDEERLQPLVEQFLKEYDEHCLDKVRPYDGVIETLDMLNDKGITLGVVTNKPHIQAVKIVEHLFSGRFCCVFGGQTAYPKKPDPESALLAAQAMGVRIEDCVFVGDSDVDVYTAHAAGIACIGCAFGFRGEEELKSVKCDEIAYSFADLQKNRLIFD